MDENNHPLLTKRFGGALGVLVAGLGIGLALMSFSPLILRALGMTIATVGAGGAAWIYWDDFRKLRLRLDHQDQPAKPLQAEQWIVLIAIAVTVFIPGYVWIWQAWPIVPSARHLTADQKALMRPFLDGVPSYVIQINSIPSCEECEDYAVELRNFFGSLRGWAVSGGPLIFPMASQLRNGITFSPDVGRDDIAQRVTKAFDAAHIEIVKTIPEKLAAGMTALILVGKQPL